MILSNIVNIALATIVIVKKAQSLSRKFYQFIPKCSQSFSVSHGIAIVVSHRAVCEVEVCCGQVFWDRVTVCPTVCVCVRHWWVGQLTFGHTRMTWQPKDIQVPSYVALSCPSLCRMLEAVC